MLQDCIGEIIFLIPIETHAIELFFQSDFYGFTYHNKLIPTLVI